MGPTTAFDFSLSDKERYTLMLGFLFRKEWDNQRRLSVLQFSKKATSTSIAPLSLCEATCTCARRALN